MKFSLLRSFIGRREVFTINSAGNFMCWGGKLDPNIVCRNKLKMDKDFGVNLESASLIEENRKFLGLHLGNGCPETRVTSETDTHIASDYSHKTSNRAKRQIVKREKRSPAPVF